LGTKTFLARRIQFCDDTGTEAIFETAIRAGELMFFRGVELGNPGQELTAPAQIPECPRRLAQHEVEVRN
jgi:hypothetical protein